MKKLAALLLSALFLLPLTACRTKETASRAETVQERYAALTSYTAAAAVELADEEENVRYTLRFDADAEETKVTVLAPELLAGVTAHLAADTLKLDKNTDCAYYSLFHSHSFSLSVRSVLSVHFSPLKVSSFKSLN